jgi:hypothetical protein
MPAGLVLSVVAFCTFFCLDTKETKGQDATNYYAQRPFVSRFVNLCAAID